MTPMPIPMEGVQHADRPPSDPELQIGPYYPKKNRNWILFDDGTVYYPKLDEYYKQDGTQVEGPSKGAKPEEYSETLEMEAAEGGRVPLGKGKLVLEGLMKLANKIAPGSTKIGQTSKTMAPKTELKQAIAGFQKREAAAKLKEMIKKKYEGRIDDKLLNQILVDDNPQRIAEVLATIDEGLIMQGKGMGPDEIINAFKESWKRKKQASGGIAEMLGE